LKIIPNKYLEEKNIEKWLSFTSEMSSHCSLVFLRRLAALARDIGHTMTGICGRRDSITQQRLWDTDLKNHKGVPSGRVARPYTSWHEFGCAVDLDGTFWKEYSMKNWMIYSRKVEKQLAKYGLMLPMNKVDSPSVLEWWHIQPIETSGIGSAKRKLFMDKDDLIYDRKIKSYPIDVSKPVSIPTPNPQPTFESALKYIAEQISTSYDFWYKKKTIDTNFSGLLIKISKCKLNKLTQDMINKPMTFEDALKIVSAKANINYDYWNLHKDCDTSFQNLVIKIGKSLG
jgi:hypothetical protein